MLHMWLPGILLGLELRRWLAGGLKGGMRPDKFKFLPTWRQKSTKGSRLTRGFRRRRRLSARRNGRAPRVVPPPRPPCSRPSRPPRPPIAHRPLAARGARRSLAARYEPFVKTTIVYTVQAGLGVILRTHSSAQPLQAPRAPTPALYQSHSPLHACRVSGRSVCVPSLRMRSRRCMRRGGARLAPGGMSEARQRSSPVQRKQRKER